MAKAKISTNYELDIDAAHVNGSINTGNNTSRVYARLIVRKLAGSGYWSNSGNDWWVEVDGRRFNNGWTYDFRSTGEVMLWQGEVTVTHDGNGYKSIGFSAGVRMSAPSGYATAGGSIGLPRVPKTPGAPVPIGLDQITASSMRYRFSGTTDGGSPIREWQYQFSPAADFAWGTTTLGWATGTEYPSGLTPGTTYYFRSRGRNDVGWGGWSSTISAKTLSGAYVSRGGRWVPAEVLVSRGGQWRSVELAISRGDQWRQPAAV